MPDYVNDIIGNNTGYNRQQATNILLQQPMQEAIQSEAQRYGIQLPDVPQQPQAQGLLGNPAFSDGLVALGAALAGAGEQGASLGAGLAVGAQGFSQAYRSREDRINAAQRQATQDQLAYLKDVAGLRINREQLDLSRTNADRTFGLQQQQFQQGKDEFAAQNAIARANLGINQAQLGIQQQEAAIKRLTIQQLLQAAQSDPSLANLTPEGVQTVLVDRAKKASEAQYAQPTDGQVLAGGFANRVAQSDQQIRDTTAAAMGPQGVGNALVGSVPFIGNSMQSAEYQKFDQASRNLINAVLRRESGAAIAPSEFDNARKQYLPAVGDSDEVLAQKAQNRQTVLNTLTKGAGRNFAIDPIAPTGKAAGGWSATEVK